MFFFLLFFCIVILCVNRSRSSFILYRIVKHHSRQSNVRRIWTCADNVKLAKLFRVASRCSGISEIWCYIHEIMFDLIKHGGSCIVSPLL